MVNCNECENVEQIGRSDGTYRSCGRKNYYCKHPDVRKVKDNRGNPITGFICFGTNTFDSPMTTKTSPRWCPLKVIVNN
jgi:hypothetical protein